VVEVKSKVESPYVFDPGSVSVIVRDVNEDIVKD
jgi:hypothetical protein